MKGFVEAVEEFEKMVARQEVDMNVVWNLDAATMRLLEEPRLILEAKNYLESLNPFIRTIILTHTFKFPLFRAIYTGEMTVEEYENIVKNATNIVQQALEETLNQVFDAAENTDGAAGGKNIETSDESTTSSENTKSAAGGKNIETSDESIDETIKEHSVSIKEALEFYKELASEYRKKYGTDDPKALRKLAEKTEDLHIEMAAEDMEAYHELIKKAENNRR